MDLDKTNERTLPNANDGLTTTDDGMKHAVIEGLKYMPSHEWAKAEGDVATVGITDHAQVRKTKQAREGAPKERTGGRRERRGGCGRSRARSEGLKRDGGDFARTFAAIARGGWASMAGVFQRGGGRETRAGGFFCATRDGRSRVAWSESNGERAIERGLTDVVRSATSLST